MSEIKVGKDSVSMEFVTPKGELVGYSAIFQPSTKFDEKGRYSANILLSKEEGEAIIAKIEEVQTAQFKEIKTKKGGKVKIEACKPYSTVDDDGNVTLDPEGRYILKTGAKAMVEGGRATIKIGVFDAKGKPVQVVKIGEGSVVRLKVKLRGYTVAGKIGVSVMLQAVQIIKLVEYATSASFDGFEVEEDGFSVEDVETAKTTNEAEETKEANDGDEEEAF